MTKQAPIPPVRKLAKVTTPPQTGPALVDLVRTALDDWAGWAGGTERGVLTPVQFLAVVLWVIQTEKTKDSDERLIVNGWGDALQMACRSGVVVCLHPVTLLPIDGSHDPRDWVLSVAHANWFLKSMPMGFDCAAVLQHFRETAAALAAPGVGELTIEAAAAERLAQKRSRWTDSQRAAAWKSIDAVGRAKTAEKFGIKTSTLNTNLGKKPRALPPKTAPMAVAGNTSPWGALVEKSATG